MALIIADDRTGLGAQFVLGVGDNFVSYAGTSILSQDNTAVYVTEAGDHLLRIEGAVGGATGGILVGVVGQAGSAVVAVGATGRIWGDLTVSVSFGLSLQTSGAVLENAGMISGFHGLVLGAADTGGAVTVVNSGTIFGRNSAIYHALAAAEDLVLLNRGQILSPSIAINYADLDATVVFRNFGHCKGLVYFGSHNDLYDGRSGTIEGGAGGPGQIIAGVGNDRMIAGRSAEFFDGGMGFDTVDYSYTTGVHVSMDGTLAGTGPALGDAFSSIEVLRGSAFGADILRGDVGSNDLFGQGGRDVLEGQGGGDQLTGGAGRDTLVGGAGDDIFYFLRFAEGGDVIRDFGQASGNEDVIVLNPAGFGFAPGGDGRAVTADEFWAVRGHHRAHDASDRFIFDSQDATLWFDPDGTGRRAAVLIADLQAGAVLTAADIYLGGLD